MDSAADSACDSASEWASGKGIDDQDPFDP